MSVRILNIVMIVALATTGSMPAADLGYMVIGVIASSENRNGIALLKNKKTSKVSAYKEGDIVEEGLSIREVLRKVVKFNLNDQIYVMSVGDDTSEKLNTESSGSSVADNLTNVQGLERKGNTLVVTKELKEELVSKNLNKILMQAATIPYLNNGRLEGFRLLEIEEGSIYDMAGFINGDVITHINDFPLTDAARAIKILNTIRNETSAKFMIQRNGAEQELFIQIQ